MPAGTSLTPSRPQDCADWERLRSESAKAFKAFTTYRDLGFDRTLKNAAEKLNKSLGTIGRWAVDYSWKSRARACLRPLQSTY
jgi:hypothetical protein